MRKFFAICAVAGMILAASSVANASISYWMSPDDLSHMDLVASMPAGGTVISGGWVTPPGLLPGRVAYKYLGELPGDPNWGQVQVGYKWAPPGAQGANSMNGHAFPDLSNFSDFRMSVHNQAYLPIKANIWINTGYTDSPWNETATFAQVPWQNDLGGWTELWQCEWIDLVLDFENASVWQNGEETLGPVPYLDHVTGIGFVVGYDGPLYDYTYSVDVDTIPEPATFLVWSLLGMASWLGMRVWRRRIPVGRQPWSNGNRAAIHDIINGR